MSNLTISLISLIPAIALCLLIYEKDKVEKEPPLLLAALFVIGAVSFVPSYYLSDRLIVLFDGLFSDYRELNPALGSVIYSEASYEVLNRALCSFVAVALVYETVRWLLLVIITSKNRNFNSLFDGLVYSAFISLGFAAADNVRYSFVNGWDNILYRSIVTIPSYLAFGIISGLFYTLWHAYTIADKKENLLFAEGKLSHNIIRFPARFLVLSLIIPTIMHGVFSYIQSSNDAVGKVIFYVLLAVVYIVCFVITKSLSQRDTVDTQAAEKIIKAVHKDYEIEKEDDTN